MKERDYHYYAHANDKKFAKCAEDYNHGEMSAREASDFEEYCSYCGLM